MHTNIGVDIVDNGLTAVTANRFKPVVIGWLVGVVCPRSIVLRATNNVGMGMLGIEGQALELNGTEASVQTENLGGYGF